MPEETKKQIFIGSKKAIVVDEVAFDIVEPENFGFDNKEHTFSYDNFTFIAISKDEEKIKSIKKHVDEMSDLLVKNREAFTKKYLGDGCGRQRDKHTIYDLTVLYTLLLMKTTKIGRFFVGMKHDSKNKYYTLYCSTRNLEEEKIEFIMDDVYALLTPPQGE